MRFFLDTEFIERGSLYPLTLISVGLISESDPKGIHLVSYEFRFEDCNGWLRTNVIPHILREPRFLRKDIKQKVLAYVGARSGGKSPEFWGYYADYDWVVFCQLFGTMIDLPKGWPMYCRDIKQLCDEKGNPRLPEQQSAEHNALNDAKWNRQAYEFLTAEGACQQQASTLTDMPESSCRER